MADKCGAKTRAGGRCRKSPLPNGRCRFHGGMSTGPKTYNAGRNALKHGIYSKYLNDEDQVIYRTQKLGTIDEELRLCRVRLNRALAAEAAANGEAELDEIVTHDLIGEEGSREDTKKKVRDYGAHVHREIGRIESLEKTRAELLKRADDEPDDDESTPIGRIILEVVSAKPSHDHDRAAG